jgi:hypothetical protein
MTTSDQVVDQEPEEGPVGVGVEMAEGRSEPGGAELMGTLKDRDGMA